MFLSTLFEPSLIRHFYLVAKANDKGRNKNENVGQQAFQLKGTRISHSRVERAAWRVYTRVNTRFLATEQQPNSHVWVADKDRLA